jgi:hypothetical protein
MRKFGSACFLAVLLLASIACTKKTAAQQLVVEIPADFNGNFVLDMGVRGAVPLPKEGAAYVLDLPRNGKAQTSTLLENPQVTFKNSSDGKVWGYSQRTFTTGDRISVGGKIEFFVGTQKQFEAEQDKKNKSGGSFKSEPETARA